MTKMAVIRSHVAIFRGLSHGHPVSLGLSRRRRCRVGAAVASTPLSHRRRCRVGAAVASAPLSRWQRFRVGAAVA